MKKLFNSLIVKFFLISCPIFLTLNVVGFHLYRDYRDDVLRSETATQVAVEIHGIGRSLARDSARFKGANTAEILSGLRGGQFVVCARFAGSNGTDSVWPFPDCKTSTNEIQEVVAPVRAKRKTIGELRVGYTLEAVAARLDKEMAFLASVLFGAGLVAFLSCLLGYVVAVGRPVRNLIAAMTRRAETGEHAYADQRSGDEVGRIAHAYNQLVDCEEERHAEIREINEKLVTEIEERIRAECELKKAHAQLLQTSKLEAIGTLSSGVAHELNTPIQYISSNLIFLKQGVGELCDVVGSLANDETALSGEEIRALLVEKDVDFVLEELPSAIAESLHGAETVAKIVGAMRSMTHPENEEFNVIDIEELVRNSATLTSNEWKLKADLQIDIGSGLPDFKGYSGGLNQVLLNLIINATHAVGENHEGEKGLIRIAVEPAGAAIRIKVSDDGIGIPAEGLTKIFDMFYTTKPVGQGTGQGLAICHSIICGTHGGTIDVSSIPGEGTVFEILLPTERQAFAA